jgi:hypothetical protein
LIILNYCCNFECVDHNCKSTTMKKLTKLFAVAIISILINQIFIPVTNAQTPEGFNYQAVLQYANGEVIANKQVGLRISILEGGVPVCVEVFNPTTNDNGMVALALGSANPTDFSAIDWSAGIFTIKIEVDPEGGTNYYNMGTSQILSVPFALHAKTSENVFSGNYADLSGKPDLSQYLTEEVDGSVTNEIELPGDAVAGDMVYFNGTSWVKLDKPTDPNFKYTLEWDFINNKPYWRFHLPSVIFNGTTLYVYPTDNSAGIRWYNGTYTTTNAKSTSDGETNTALIVANQGPGSYAAQLCSDLTAFGYDDWYLPSKDELNAIYLDKEVIGGFTFAYYWSSTEFSMTDAWGQDFNNGSQVTYGKYPTSRVRCVRK